MKGFFYVTLDYGRKLEHVSSKIKYFYLVSSCTNRNIISILYLWGKILLKFVEFINLKLNKNYSFAFEDFLAIKSVKS